MKHRQSYCFLSVESWFVRIEVSRETVASGCQDVDVGVDKPPSIVACLGTAVSPISNTFGVISSEIGI